MATHDYIIANASGAAVRADLNNALAAIVSNNSSATAPATTYAYQWWADTTANQLKLRNAANDDWIVIQELDGTMLMEDGTAAAPGLAFADDVDTGLFRPAANQLGIATNGVERVEFGTTEVVFNDSGANVDFRVEGDTAGNLLFVDAGNDRVGIGTNSPTEILTIDGNIEFESSNQAIKFAAGNAATNSIECNSGTGPRASIDFLGVGSAQTTDIVFKTAETSSTSAERVRIKTSTGHVGIGTSSPDVLLHIDEAAATADDTPEVKISSFRPTIRLDDKSSSANSAEICGDNALIFRCSAPVDDDTALTEHMRITAAGNVGIATSSPTRDLTIHGTGESLLFDLDTVTNGAYSSIAWQASTSAFSEGDMSAEIRGYREASGALGALAFHTRSSTTSVERMRIISSGNVGIGTDSPQTLLTLGSTTASDQRLSLFSNTSSDGDAYGSIEFRHGVSNGNINSKISALRSGGSSGGALTFFTRTQGDAVNTDGGSERMRIDSSGNVVIGKTAIDTATVGGELRADGFIGATREDNVPLLSNREGNEGSLVTLRHDNVTEGTISVSGTTVSYNGGHLSRWSQLAGNAARTEILRGSVLSNLDEMCEWAYEAKDAVLYTEEDDLPEGVSVGDVKEPAVAAGTENNEQLNRMKVSDVEGDVNVAGVFQCWDDDDDTYANDFYCAMTGDFVIRIAQGTTIARGDLLMSAGDGTAKPQDDDIVRSKTIAKVISTTVSTTYADGSYCVPCVLMAC